VFLGGMGEAGITTVGTRKDYFEDGIKNGPNAKDARAGAYIQTILKQRGMSPEAALGVLSTQVSTPREALALIKTPVRVVNGDQDRDNGDPMALAAALGNATCELVPGNHLSAVAEPAFRDALVAFLS
jgi:pimeloyl-ACP methyl ester carboxylesterase